VNTETDRRQLPRERILIVEAHEETAAVLSEALSGKGFNVQLVSGVIQGRRVLDSEPVDVVITDVSHPDCGGGDFLRSIGDSPLVSIIATGQASVREAVEAMRDGAFHYLPRPVDGEEFLHVLDKCLAHRRLSHENLALRREATLFKIIKSVSVTLDLQRLIQLVMDSSMELSGATSGSLLLLSKDSKSLTYHALRGVEKNIEADGRFGFSENYLLSMIRSEKSVLDSGTGIALPELGGRAVLSALICPVVADARPLGLVMAVRDERAGKGFSDVDVRMLSTFSSEIAESLQNAKILKKTRELTVKDDLTEAYNRRFFESYLDEELKRARRFGSPLSLIFMDVDNLKEVNSEYGHLMGSHVLKVITHRVILTIRGIDKVIRYGGDEFCILLPETDTKGAQVVAERIRKTISREPIVFDQQHEVTLTSSFGIASFPQHAGNAEQLLRRADRALFEVKNREKNGVGVASAESDISPFNKKSRRN
jgi:diguanylate cyclase (GGDEF)-like protein